MLQIKFFLLSDISDSACNGVSKYSLYFRRSVFAAEDLPDFQFQMIVHLIYYVIILILFGHLYSRFLIIKIGECVICKKTNVFEIVMLWPNI